MNIIQTIVRHAYASDPIGAAIDDGLIPSAITADEFITNFTTQILQPVVALMVAAALVIFLWGLIEFIAGSGNEEKRTAGKTHMIWGTVGLFIMISVWGILNLICETIGAC